MDHKFFLRSIICLTIAITSFSSLLGCKTSTNSLFNPKRAYENIEIQLAFGPRFPGSIGHQQEIKWIKNILDSNSWVVEEQVFSYKGTQITNILAKKGEENPLIVLGAHYDTRKISDKESDLNKRLLPVPGANDGASGVAVLLELARILPDENRIQLVFFDAEDQGNISNWEWSIGSEHYVKNLYFIPEKAVILDMVADKDLQFYQEAYSDRKLSSAIWIIGQRLGYSNVFFDEIKYAMIDDHRPFINSGIPALLIIDFDYPYWHTQKDQIDAVSIESLNIIGTVIFVWIKTSLLSD